VTAQATPKGLGWVQVGIGEQSLTGFAHGNAGRALALFQLAAATGLPRYRQAARDALGHERSQFMAAAANWPDLRTVALADRSPDQPLPCRTSWCHGAPGIGMARLATLAYHDDAEIRGEIEVATRTTLAQGFGDNHCVCHGDLGNVELLLLGGEVLGDAELTAQAYRHAAAILRDIHESGIRCGVPRHVETPGLFTGLAGIGYQLLRLADPARVPSILTLALPR
jgi:lantibiotic modifying enzyme